MKQPLGNLAKFVSGGTPSKQNPAFWGGDTPWVSAKDLKSIRISKSIETLSDEGRKVASLVPKGAILLLVRGMSLFKTIPLGVADRELAINQDVKGLVSLNGVSSLFLAYSLLAQTEKLLQMVEAAGHGTGRLDTDALKELLIWVPSKKEQTLIVEIMTTWDTAIEKTEQLIAAKEQRLAALSHLLLFGKKRVEGKSTSLRKAPHGPPLPKDWLSVEIGQVAQEVSKFNRADKKLPVLSCTKHSGLVDSLKYFDKQVFSHDTTKYKVVQGNQFAYATNHIEEGSIGYQDLSPAGLVSPIYTVFKTDPSKVCDGYLYKLLKTETLRKVFEARTNASVNRRGSLRWIAFSKIHIPLPPLNEQVAINTILEDARREIALHQENVAALKIQKRGLMQKLLTGEIRSKGIDT